MADSGGGTWRLSDIDLGVAGSGRALRLECVTWNVGNEDPTAMWPTVLNNLPPDLDVLVLGLQESTFSVKDKKGASSVLGNADLLASINHTKGVLTKALPHMRIVKHCYRAQMQLYVFADHKLTNRISNVEERVENTGFLHIFPNKGGLLVSFMIDGTKLAFLSCHLAAHEGVEMCEVRNSSVEEILGGVRVLDQRFDVSVQSHHTFFMGDMNYRCTYDTAVPKSQSTFDDAAKEEQQKAKIAALHQKGEDDEDEDEDDAAVTSDGSSNKLTKKAQKDEDRKKILALVTAEAWPELLRLDELSREVSACRVLTGFTPAVPSFPPTFKRTRHHCIPPSAQQTAGSRRWDLIDTAVELYAPPADSPLPAPSLAAAAAASAEAEAAAAPPAPALAQATSKRPSIFGGSIKVKDKDKAKAELALLPANHVRQFYDRKRIPSYTDRVLTRSLPRFQSHLELLSFISLEDVETSDHKPVKASFAVRVGGGAAEISVETAAEPFAADAVALRDKGLLLELVLTGMKGANLAAMDSEIFGGGSDPFVIVTADPPQIVAGRREPRSSVITHNLNPDWGDEELVVPLLTKDLDGLSHNAHILISAWDYDKTKNNDLIGVASVSLRDIVDSFALGKALAVAEPLLQNGLHMGTFSANISLRVPNWTGAAAPTALAIREAFDQSGTKPLSELKSTRAGSCCLVM